LKIKIYNASESDQNKSLFYKNFKVTANYLKEKKEINYTDSCNTGYQHIKVNENRTGYEDDLSTFFDDMHLLEHHTSTQTEPCLVISSNNKCFVLIGL